jgi:Ca2+-binding RTX toxin-like protein
LNLVIRNFGFTGVVIGGPGSNQVRGNIIGLDTANTDQGNGAGGVVVSFSPNNVIGGSAAADRNIISGNGFDGVFIGGPPSTGNSVLGNYIGTNTTGTLEKGNDGAGVLVGGGASNNTIGGTTGVTPASGCTGACNLISGNNRGVDIQTGGPDSTNNVVEGNYIGTNASGLGAIPNLVGVTTFAVSNNTIGGTTAQERNLISGNEVGVNLGSNSSNNIVSGNYIGTTRSGNAALANAANGVRIISGGMGTSSNGNVIGGTAPGAGNVISGNGLVGVFIVAQNQAVTSGNRIEGNRIGVAANGSVLANQGGGLAILDAINNSIGGTATGAGNVIAFNGANGVSVGESVGTSVGNALRGNSIHDNANIGIDLGTPPGFLDGVTANDLDDPDGDSNNLQNFPVLTVAYTSAPGTTVQGTLNSRPNRTYRIEFFASDACDGSGNGEGEKFLGFVTVTTNAGGDATFNKGGLAGASPGDVITSTATRTNGDTSEFSLCLTAVAAPLCAGSPATHVGTAGNNTINGRPVADVMFGLGGNDTLNGLGGSDKLCGGNGNDTLNGGTGADTINGDAGNDTATGSDGNDMINGGAGADTLQGGIGTDTAHGNENDDNLFGEGGADSLFGDSGADDLDGGTGVEMTCDGGTGSSDTAVNCDGNVIGVP